MTKFGRLIFSFLLVSFFLTLHTQPAAACTCAINPSPLEEFNLSTAVFTGRVVSTDLLLGLGTSNPYPVKVVLEVDTIWKGPKSNRIAIHTAIDEGGCGFDFNVGWSYLVYARGEASFLEVNSCTRTTMLSYAREDLEVLGEGCQVTDSWLAYRTPMLISVGLGIGIVAILVVWKRFNMLTFR